MLPVPESVCIAQHEPGVVDAHDSNLVFTNRRCVAQMHTHLRPPRPDPSAVVGFGPGDAELPIARDTSHDHDRDTEQEELGSARRRTPADALPVGDPPCLMLQARLEVP